MVTLMIRSHAMRTVLLSLLIVLFCFSTLFGQETVVDEVEFQIDTDNENISQKKSVADMISKYLTRMGWEHNENYKNDGSMFFIGVGEGAIQAPIDHPGYLQSRINAFDKALLSSKQDLAEYLETAISTEAQKTYREGRAENQDVNEETVDENSISYKLQKLTHAKLDKLLLEEGITPATASDEQIKKALAEVATQEDFKKYTATVAKSLLSGIQVFKCFEGPGEGKGYVIGVVTIYSDKLREMASSIYTGRKPTTKTPKIPIIEQIPQDNAILMGTFGIQQKTDENGDLVLVSFGQAAPKTLSSNSISMAYRKAKIECQGYIRTFAGENFRTTGDVENAESTTEYEDETKEYKNKSAFDAIVKSTSKNMKISGIQQVKKWKHTHPITGKPMVGVVCTWSPRSSSRAKNISDQMSRTPESRTPASSKKGDSGRKELDHSGITGSGAEADEDSF